jgi:hypothetical protein
MANKKVNPVDCLEQYQSDKLKLTKSEREELINNIVNTDADTTARLLDEALDEDKSLIIDLTIQIESDNVVDFIVWQSNLDTTQLNLLAKKLISTKRLVSKMITSLVYCANNNLKVPNAKYILDNTNIMQTLQSNSTKKNFNLINKHLISSI